jgi:hypothetical protein
MERTRELSIIKILKRKHDLLFTDSWLVPDLIIDYRCSDERKCHVLRGYIDAIKKPCFRKSLSTPEKKPSSQKMHLKISPFCLGLKSSLFECGLGVSAFQLLLN